MYFESNSKNENNAIIHITETIDYVPLDCLSRIIYITQKEKQRPDHE